MSFGEVKYSTGSFSLIWLCKRQYMNKDVLDDHYGRLYEIPLGLSLFSSVSLILMSYRESTDYSVAVSSGLLTIHARSGNSTVIRFSRWLRVLFSVSRRSRSGGVIIASSDVLHVITGSLVSALLRKPFFADLYDNYESFGLAKLPLVKVLYRMSLRRAAGISVVSEALGGLVAQQYPSVPCLVLESTIDNLLFYPRDKAESRAALGLSGGPVLGICGGLNSEHDIATVFEACALLDMQGVSFTLLVAGRVGDVPVPDVPYISYVGMRAHEEMPHFFSALDVALIPMAKGEFGHYAFPQKAYEILACQVPAVAAEVGALGKLFERFGGVTYEPGDAASLSKAIEKQLNEPVVADITIPDWSDQCSRLNAFIHDILRRT